MNVEGDAAAMDLLHGLGADSVPVVSKGEHFVYAQSIGDVADFLGLDAAGAPQLSPPELTMIATLDTTAKLLNHRLLAITNPEHRQTGFENPIRCPRRAPKRAPYPLLYKVC